MTLIFCGTEWTLLQAKLHSMEPPLRVAKAVQYTKLRHYEVAGGLLHELLRLRGMDTGPDMRTVQGIINWIRGHMQVAEDLGVSGERVPDFQKVWFQ